VVRQLGGTPAVGHRPGLGGRRRDVRARPHRARPRRRRGGGGLRPVRPTSHHHRAARAGGLRLPAHQPHRGRAARRRRPLGVHPGRRRAARHGADPRRVRGHRTHPGRDPRVQHARALPGREGAGHHDPDAAVRAAAGRLRRPVLGGAALRRPALRRGEGRPRRGDRHGPGARPAGEDPGEVPHGCRDRDPRRRGPPGRRHLPVSRGAGAHAHRVRGVGARDAERRHAGGQAHRRRGPG